MCLKRGGSLPVIIGRLNRQLPRKTYYDNLVALNYRSKMYGIVL